MLGSLRAVLLFGFDEFLRRETEHRPIAAHVERLGLVFQHSVDCNDEHADIGRPLAPLDAFRTVLAALHDVHLSARRHRYDPVALEGATHVIDALQELLHDCRLFLDTETIGLVHDEHQWLVEHKQVPYSLAFGPRQVTIADEQHDVGTLRFFERHLVQALFVTPGARHVGQQDLAACTALPSIVPHVTRRTPDDVDDNIRLGHERLD